MSRVNVFLVLMVIVGVVLAGSVTAQNQPEPYDSKPKKESDTKSDTTKTEPEKKAPEKKAPEKKTPEKKAPEKKAPEKKTPVQSKAKTPMAEQTASSAVKRAAFTTSVVEREPTNNLDSLTTDVDQIFFFTEIVDMQGTQVTHRWIYGDTVMAEVPFEVGGPRWRVYSSKKLLPGWAGTWTVDVVDATGKTLLEDTFVYVASPQ